MKRRQFLRLSMAVGAAPALLFSRSQLALAQKHPPPEGEQLTHYQLGPQIWLRWDNAPLTCYRAQPKQKYPYLYPLSGPVSGLSLTSETALPWPHHRSLFFACDRVNGGNYWQEDLERGQIISSGPRVVESAKTSAVIVDQCEWAVPGQPVQMKDRRKFTVAVPSPRLRLIDAEIEWIAEADVTVQKTNHALYSIRAATDISPWGGGTLVSSEGRTGEKNTFGKPARWCAFYGKRAPEKSGPVEGIALMDHPSNPWSPCPWFTRDYGFISPMPFQWIEEPWKLAAGKTARLKYRVVLFAGEPQEAGIENLYRSWA
ncbi:MAG: DUF6807 family protein [Verrucomicrobiia bacterium]